MIEKDRQDTVITLYSYDEHEDRALKIAPVEQFSEGPGCRGGKGLLQQIPGLAPKRTEYVYDLVSGNVNFVMYQYGYEDQFIHRYSYDADNRIEDVHTSTDGYLWNREATYHYYPHGPLARVELGEYNVQGMDYYYTLQGWLKGVNMPGDGDPGADGMNGLRTGKDAFAFTLGYHADDFKPINPNAVTSDGRDQLWNRYDEQRNTSGLYNGNIAWMNTDLPGLEQDPMQAMIYNYDQLHRIVEARSLREYSSNGYATRTVTPKAYDVDYSYDGNGNLLTLNRRNEQGSVQDDFEYSYYENTNKLRNIDPSTGSNYQYDEVGNLVADVSEGITGIEWTPYGKIRSVNKSDGTKLEFRYDAAGQRIEKKVGESIQRYVKDASGNPMAIYESDSLAEQSIYGSSRLGIQVAGSQQGYRTLGGKRYELSNHLGNVLAVVTDNIHMDQDSTWAQVSSLTDYYPFGLAMKGRSFQDTRVYRYGFGGHEKDDEIKGHANHLSFGDYGYDPRLGKRWNVDPMTNEMPGTSPYSYAYNNPVLLIDPDGKLPIIPFLIKAGAAGATDMLLQVGMNYLLDDDVQTIGLAFEKVDWVDVSISAAQGALPWSVPGGKFGKAAAAATGDVLINAGKATLNNKDYSMESAAADFFIGFVSQLSADQVGELLSSKNAQQKLAKLLPEEELGIIYERIDKTGKLKPYVGQAKNDSRFAARQKEHARANPDSRFKFKEIDKGKPGADLNQKEQKALDTRGGPTNKSNPNGGTSNKKNVIKKE